MTTGYLPGNHLSAYYRSGRWSRVDGGRYTAMGGGSMRAGDDLADHHIWVME